MPADIKPLFRADALRPKLGRFVWPPEVEAARPKLTHWAALLGSGQADAMKETELLGDFISDIFFDLLGYTGPASGLPVYTLKREALVEVDGKFADAALGRFTTAGGAAQFVVAVEGKGPRDPLDRPFAGRRRSAVDQALQYVVNLQIDWYLVTNLKETRLYHKGHDLFTYERFETAALAADAAALRKFVYLLAAERVVPAAGLGHLDDLLAESRRIGRELTNDYYHEYATLRRQTFDELRKHNPDVPPADLIAATQKILDRVLFIAFCEDRGLLPNDIIASAYQDRDKFNPRPVWDNFLGLFRAVNEGSASLEISRYNGGLFATDAVLDRLKVPDVVCQGFAKIASYEYGHWSDDPKAKLIDVEILGHIFEQSISDLEELQRRVILPPLPVDVSPTRQQGRTVPLLARRAQADTGGVGPSKRKKEGAFYTPEFVTRYIVAQTLGPVLAERFEAHRSQAQESAPKTLRKLFDDPKALDPADLKPAQRQALVKFWNAWHVALGAVRVVDPACGSGAFLIEAFEQLSAEYQRAVAWVRDLGETELFDVDREILESNLYGMDLNAEAVEIARLSLWIKTAQEGKVLTSLDDNVKQGNSVVAEPAPLDAWRERFPAVFAAGGFDVVIGNPPYVRQEWIAKDKPFLEKHYRAYDGVADLYVYFYELGLNLLRPGGRLGFVVTNKWMRAGYGEPLRRLFGEAAWVDSVVDFGHAKQIFPDADVFPSILTIRKPTAEPPPATARVCAIPREQLRIDDLSRQIETEGFAVPRERLRGEPWSLEPPGATALMAKIRAGGAPLKQFVGHVPLYGIKTGFNEAFLIGTPKKDALMRDDPNSSRLLKPYLRGQDIQRWRAEWNGLWMLALQSSGNYRWPWAGAGVNAEGIFANAYPAIYAHVKHHRESLANRQDQGENWWELRACAYWDRFAAKKAIIQRIAFHSRIALDSSGMFVNDSAIILETPDLWLLAVLNSPVLWYYMFRTMPHKKDEALAMDIVHFEQLPIPRTGEPQTSRAETAVAKLISLAGDQQAGGSAMFDWLRVEFAVEKPSQRLQNLAVLDADTLIAEVKKARGKTKSLSVAEVKRLREEHARSVAPLHTLAAEARQLEMQVSDLVNEAYGLTPDEVALMWQTAPPRMPVGPPE